MGGDVLNLLKLPPKVITPVIIKCINESQIGN